MKAGNADMLAARGLPTHSCTGGIAQIPLPEAGDWSRDRPSRLCCRFCSPHRIFTRVLRARCRDLRCETRKGHRQQIPLAKKAASRN